MGLNCSACSFCTSLAKTCSAGAVESMQLALTEMTVWPSFLRNMWELIATIRACAVGEVRKMRIDRRGGKGSMGGFGGRRGCKRDGGEGGWG